MISAGAELSGDLPPTRDFLIGGIRSFPGLKLNELRGSSYWVAGANYRLKVANILQLFNQSLYAGLRLQAGRVGDRRDEINDGTLYGISGSLSGLTPIGAFILSLGYVDNNSLALQFAIGRPLPEGSLLDETY
jgi:outer membrane translocation and assembly module TamA